MATDLERALQAGGQLQEQTDFQKAQAAGGKLQETVEDRGVLSFANRAIAATFGAPVDIATAGLNLIPGVDIQDPVGGSESIGGVFRGIGAETALQTDRPETLRENIGAGIGEGVSMLIPFTKGAQLAARGTGTVGRVSKVILDGIQKHPFITGVTELTAGAGTGAGREIVERTDSPNLRATLELSGSLIGGIAPVALTFTPVRVGGKITRTVLKRVGLPFTEQGSRFRAGQALKAQTADPIQAGVEATADTIGDLPPAIASGEKRLMAAFNQLRALDPVVDADAVEKVGHSIKQLEQELRSQGFGAPEVLQNSINKRIASLQLGMDKRVADAMEIADNRLSALPVARRQSEESVIVREELNKVMKSAKANVDNIWKKVPKEAKVEIKESKILLKKLIAETPKAQSDDIPSILTSKKMRFVFRGTEVPTETVVDPFTGATSTSIKPVRKGRAVSVGEVQGLRTKLGEVAAKARAEKDWNRARIADLISDSLLDDIETSGGDATLKVAIEATRKFKTRFNQGIVGKIMGRDRTGTPSISPELTLEKSLGRAGVAGSLDINNVVVTPEARVATKRFLSKSFTDFVTDKQTKDFNVNKAAKWVEANNEVLDQFPELRAELQDIEGAFRHAENTSALLARRKKNIESPTTSVTAKFLNAAPGKEIDAVFKSKNPLGGTKELMRKARKDASGEALDGLKRAYVDYFTEQSSVGPFNEVGEQIISGKRLTSMLGKHGQLVREMFSPDEIGRLRRVARELSKIELSEGIKGRQAELLEDRASNALRLFSRVGGAQFGRFVAKVTGGGTVQTPGIFSQRAQVLMEKMNIGRANALVKDAIIGEDGGQLLKALLLPLEKPTAKGTRVTIKENLQELNKQISRWMIGTGSRIARDIEQEEQETP